MSAASSAANDIYALGATIYDLLTGRPPFFDRDQESVMMQIERASPPSMSERRQELAGNLPDEIPPSWEALVQDCLKKDPGERPKSIREVAGRLGFELPARSSSPPPFQPQQPAKSLATTAQASTQTTPGPATATPITQRTA